MKLSLTALGATLRRLRAWPFTRPIARGAFAAIALVVLVVVGRATFAGAAPAARMQPDPVEPSVAAAAASPPAASAAESEPPASIATPAPADPAPAVIAAAVVAPSPPAQVAAHGAATPDDPVFLNEATSDDLQRLPGVGQKRALAILDLRTRLGHFHQIEDLLKVRGIGIKTLRRLRPLLRLDRPAAAPDAATG